MNLAVLLTLVFLFLVFVVGGYVWMFLNVMRTDPREQEFREKHGHDDTLIPHKYRPRESQKNKEEE